MYCIIQEVKTRTKSIGNSRRIEVVDNFYPMLGDKYPSYSYKYSDDRCDRDIMKAYQISIRISRREAGKVRKQQFSVCTINYYSIANGEPIRMDYIFGKVEQIAEKLDVTIQEIYDLIEPKYNALSARIIKEYQETEDYKQGLQNKQIIEQYEKNKAEFARKYNIYESEYDKIYDVFGNLRNKAYLQMITSNKRGYYRKTRNTHNKEFEDGFCGYFEEKPNTHTEEEAKILRKFYKSLSKLYHPDANPGIDTSKEMQLLNELKIEWGL